MLLKLGLQLQRTVYKQKARPSARTFIKYFTNVIQPISHKLDSDN